MRHLYRKSMTLAAGVLAACFLAASASAPAAPTTGPCLPPGTPVPPGLKLPPCTKAPAKSPFEVKVSGSVTVAFTSHTANWGHCTPALGGGAHTVASTELDFGQPGWEHPTVGYTLHKGAKSKALTHVDASPRVQMTMRPTQDQRHDMPPGCGVVKDPTSCGEMKGSSNATVHVNAVLDRVRVTFLPPTVFSAAQCSAPFTPGDNRFDNLTYEHELDEEDTTSLVFLGDRKGYSARIQWNDPKKPCSEYGGPKDGTTYPFGGTIDTCTVKADFLIQLRHLS